MEKEPPSTLMWTLFLLAQVCAYFLDDVLIHYFVGSSIFFLLIEFLLVQHYDRRGQYEIALSKINEAIDHTPTVIDLYSVKVLLIFLSSSLLVSDFFLFYVVLALYKFVCTYVHLWLCVYKFVL